MKFNLKHIAIAAAMVAASPAFAVNVGPDDGGGEMFLNVWQVAGTNGGTVSASYALDLNVTYAQFLANNNVNLYINQIINDSYFSQMLAAASGSLSALQFSVFGGDRVDTAGTLTSTFASATAKPSTGAELNSGLDQIANYTGALNATGSFIPLPDGTPTVGGASYNTSGASYYGNNAGLNTLVGNSSPNSGLVGSALTVAQFTQTGDAPSKVVYPGQFFFGQQAGNYVLQYQVAAVPEPTGYALALAGFGIVGFVARRRKNS